MGWKRTHAVILSDLEVIRWAHGGDGVAVPASGPLEGMVVFVPGGVPGDRVRARIKKRKKRWARVELLEVERPSPGRVAPRCAIQERCGGCPWMAGDRQTQSSSRLKILRGEIAKTLQWGEERLSRDVALAEHAGPEYGYRRRARLAWRLQGCEVTLGYRARGSHRLIPVARCEVVVEAINSALNRVRQAIAELGDPAGEATILAADNGVAWSLIGESGARALGGEPDPVVTVNGRQLSMKASCFAQGNASETDAIARHILSLVGQGGGAHAVELFAGSGTWTAGLIDAGYRVTAYELDGKTRESFQKNCTGEEATLHTADLLEIGIPEPLPERADLVLVDPPRIGAAALTTWLRASAAPTIVMVSCDVATGVRDAAALAEGPGGYAIERITSYDMFPHTGHQELVIELRRRDG